MYLHVLKAAQLCDHSAARFGGPIPQLGSQFGVLYCLPSCCTFFSDAAEGCSGWSQLLVICKQPSSEATQCFSVRRERRESAMFSGIWKLLTLTLSPLHWTKFVLEDWNKTHWRKLRNFYNSGSLQSGQKSKVTWLFVSSSSPVSTVAGCQIQ